jgi:hypothetical protein
VTTNAPDVAEVAAWMQANGLVAESLDWLTSLPNHLLDQRPVQMALVQGYLQNRQWTAMLNIASQANWGDLEYLRLALVFRAWSQLGSAGLADTSWNAAMGTAAGHRAATIQLLQLAESWHLQQKQEAVLLQMVQESPEDNRARQELESLYFNSGNTLGLHQLYAILNAHFPDAAADKNNLAATALLLKMDVPKARQWAADDYAKDPGDPYVASTYAFALHLQGRDKQGLAVFGKTPAGGTRAAIRGPLLWSAARGRRKRGQSHALASDRPNQRPFVAGRTGVAFRGAGQRSGLQALIVVFNPTRRSRNQEGR